MTIDIAGAEKKLRQALFFLGWLDQYPRDMPLMGGNPEPLEFYFSACLSAAQSVYYVLKETGGAIFHDGQKLWRERLPEPQRSQFGRMIGLRGNDVHFAATGAESLPKFVPEEPRLDIQSMHWRRVAALYPIPETEMENPDGTKVGGGHGLRGTIGLYIEQRGRRIEAAEACREFIERLGSLLEEVRGARRPGAAEGFRS